MPQNNKDPNSHKHLYAGYATVLTVSIAW